MKTKVILISFLFFILSILLLNIKQLYSSNRANSLKSNEIKEMLHQSLNADEAIAKFLNNESTLDWSYVLRQLANDNIDEVTIKKERQSFVKTIKKSCNKSTSSQSLTFKNVKAVEIKVTVAGSMTMG
jgi:hypothetical protein